VATLGLTEVSSRLDGQFDHLFGGMRTALPRHQTLRATLEWSYALLGEEERALLRRLSIFAGYFTMRSVMRVASGVGADPANIPDIVGSLVTKSLLSSNVAAPDAQYRMLKTTRDFALELLRADGEYDIIARRHVEYCCDEIKDVETDAGALSDGQWLQRYGNSLDDVRNALFWSLEQGNDRELGAALTSLAIPLWARFSLFNDCRRFIQGALTLFDQQSETGSRREMQLLAALSNILMNTAGPAPETIDAAQRARKIAEAAGDIDYQLRTIQTLWNGCFSSGEIRKSEQLALTFQQIAKASRDPSDDLLAHRLYATSQFYLGNLSDAEKHIEQMLAGYAALPHGTNFARFGVAQLASARALQLLILLFRGFPDQAIKASEECVSEALRTRNALTICSVISSTCISTALLIGDCESANRYTSIVLEHAERAGLTRWHELGRCFQAILQIKAGSLPSGISTLCTLLDNSRLSNNRYIHIFSEFAEALAKAGNVNRALAIIDELLQCEFVVHRPGLLYHKGRFTLMLQDPGAAENAERTFWEALETARRQGIRLFELYIAVDLATLLEQQGRRALARRTLGSAYEGFAEGFNTKPLIEARKTLERLNG
jgi:predicted ATPase